MTTTYTAKTPTGIAIHCTLDGSVITATINVGSVTYRGAPHRPVALREAKEPMNMNPYTGEPYTDEALLAAVAHHAQGRGLTMDLTYRTAYVAPAELLAGEAQFKILVTELERRDVCGAGDLFTNKGKRR